MRRAAILVLLTGLAGAGARAADVRWIEDSFADFRDGRFDASGQNMYVTAAGRISSIHRFDLNSDGYQDLVFNSSHDFVTGPPATVVRYGAESESAEIPVRGSTCATVADLNKDGHLDLVVCPNNAWITPRRHGYVFWGAASGWERRRMTNFVTISPVAVGVADLDNDSWLDLIVLNGSRWAPEDGPGRVLRVMWGSESGYRQEAYKDVVLDKARDLVVQDLDGDARADLAVLLSPLADGEDRDNAEVWVYWNSGGTERDLPEPQRLDLDTQNIARLAAADVNGDSRLDLVISGGVRELVSTDPTTQEKTYRYSGVVWLGAGPDRTWLAPRQEKAPKSRSFAAADLDRDGFADLIFASGRDEPESVSLLWGDGQGGFEARQPAGLPISYASAVAVTDADQDGHADLVVGVYQQETVYQSVSRVFLGDGQGGFRPGDLEIPTAGVVDVIAAPPDPAHGPRFVFCNNISGRIHEDVPVRVFWGGRGGFEPERFSKFRIRSGYCSNAADLNADGYPDLILASIVHNVSKPHPERGFNILWGGPDGLEDDRRTVVQEYAMTNTNVADMDRDGYLDLLGTCNKPSEDEEPPRLVIWHGGPDGFRRERRVMIPTPGASGPNLVADFDRDGLLDVAVSCGLAHCVRLFRGTPAGIDPDTAQVLPLVAADDMGTADLDADGWLDLIVTSYFIPGTMNYDFGTYIYWGGATGFSPTNAQRLRGSAGCGISVADYDQDGHLDLHVPNYKWSEIREAVQSFLYWGSPDGYSELNRTALVVDSGHATQSADFNGDGLIDLAISCHSLDGDHRVNSRVYFNDGSRFTSPRCQLLPTIGPHYMHRADVGNLYDRSRRLTYVSSVFEWGEERRRGRLRYDAAEPGASRLLFAVRSAPAAADLAQRQWVPVVRGRFRLPRGDRVLQYRALFTSDNGDRYPILDRVDVRLRD